MSMILIFGMFVCVWIVKFFVFGMSVKYFFFLMFVDVFCFIFVFVYVCLFFMYLIFVVLFLIVCIVVFFIVNLLINIFVCVCVFVCLFFVCCVFVCFVWLLYDGWLIVLCCLCCLCVLFCVVVWGVDCLCVVCWVCWCFGDVCVCVLMLMMCVWCYGVIVVVIYWLLCVLNNGFVVFWMCMRECVLLIYWDVFGYVGIIDIVRLMFYILWCGILCVVWCDDVVDDVMIVMIVVRFWDCVEFDGFECVLLFGLIVCWFDVVCVDLNWCGEIWKFEMMLLMKDGCWGEVMVSDGGGVVGVVVDGVCVCGGVWNVGVWEDGWGGAGRRRERGVDGDVVVDKEESVCGWNGGRDGFCGDVDVCVGVERCVECEWGGLGVRGGRAGGDFVSRRAIVGVVVVDEGVDVVVGVVVKVGVIVWDVVWIYVFVRGYVIWCEWVGWLRGVGDVGVRGIVRDDFERVGCCVWVVYDWWCCVLCVISELWVWWCWWVGSCCYWLLIFVRVRGRSRAFGVEFVFVDGCVEIFCVLCDDECKCSVCVLLWV